jgi:hypothetical protein
MKKHEWILREAKRPKRRQICDFIYNGTAETPLVWILCSVTEGEAWDYGYPSYWRPAEALPSGVNEYES